MDSAKHTLRNYKPEYQFEKGELYYDKPQPASKLEKSILWLIISIGVFLFWKNVFQVAGVI